MFLKNYNILYNRTHILSPNANYAMYNGRINPFTGFTSTEEYKGLRFPNGNYFLKDYELSYVSSSYGIGCETVTYKLNGSSIGTIIACNSGIITSHITDNSNTSCVHNDSNGPNYMLNRPFFRFGAGIAGDITPVTKDDYVVDNMIFDDTLTIDQKQVNGGFYYISLANITSFDVTIRQIGAYVNCLSLNNNNLSEYNSTDDPFTLYLYSSSYYPALLIWKVKLDTPIVIPANSSKVITVEFPLPE